MRKCKVYISNIELPALLTENEQEQLNGLMHVQPPPPIMVFNYNKPKNNKFWMKNTPSPLDIVFCNNNKIIDICYGKPYSTSLIGGDYESDMIVELPYKTCEGNNISIGDSCKISDISDNLLSSSKIFAHKYY